MLEITIELFKLMLLAVSGGVIVGFVARMLGCLFSADSRKKVRDRPVLHAVWLIAGILTTIWWDSIAQSRFRPTGETGACKNDVVSVARALHGIHERYGRYPLQSSLVDHSYDADQPRLIRILCCMEKDIHENPDDRIFLEVNPTKMGDGGMIDPWDNPMNILADWSGDGRVSVGKKVLHKPVAVWSDGPNGKNEFGSGDDITSW